MSLRRKAWVKIVAVSIFVGAVVGYVGSLEKFHKLAEGIYESYYSKTNLKFRAGTLRKRETTIAPVGEYSLDTPQDKPTRIPETTTYQYELTLKVAIEKNSVPPVEQCKATAVVDGTGEKSEAEEVISLSRGRFDQAAEYMFSLQLNKRPNKWRFQITCKDVISDWIVFGN